MVATLGDRHQDRFRQRGIRRLHPLGSLDVLKDLIVSDGAQSAVLAIDWPTFFAAFGAIGPIPAVFDILRREAGEPADAASHTREGLLERLRDCAAGEQYDVVQDYVERSARQILRLGDATIDVDQPLNELGLDSLMSVEFKNAIKRETDIDLPVVKLLRGISISEISAHLCEQIAPTGEGTPALDETADMTGLEQMVEGEI
jgi:acyl carrier protein